MALENQVGSSKSVDRSSQWGSKQVLEFLGSRKSFIKHTGESPRLSPLSSTAALLPSHVASARQPTAHTGQPGDHWLRNFTRRNAPWSLLSLSRQDTEVVTQENQGLINLEILKNSGEKETSQKARIPARRLNGIPNHSNLVLKVTKLYL